MRRHRVGQAAWIVDPGERGKNLGRNLHVQFDVLVKFIQDGACERLAFLVRKRHGLEHCYLRGKIIFRFQIFLQNRAAFTLDQHLDGAIRQFQQLQDAGNRSDIMNVICRRIVIRSALLRHQHDLLAGLHGLLKGADRLAPTYKQRDNHVRKHDDIAQWKNGDVRLRSWNYHGWFGFWHLRFNQLVSGFLQVWGLNALISIIRRGFFSKNRVFQSGLRQMAHMTLQTALVHKIARSEEWCRDAPVTEPRTQFGQRSAATLAPQGASLGDEAGKKETPRLAGFFMWDRCFTYWLTDARRLSCSSFSA